MKTYFGVVVLAALIVVASIAVAGPMTWSKPLVCPAHSTLGENQRIDMQQAVDTEMRVRIAAGLKFAGYSTQGNGL